MKLHFQLISKTIENTKFNIKWIGCDAAFGCDHDFVDNLPKTACYFVATNKNERIFMPDSDKPQAVITLADDENYASETVGFETSKGIINSEIKIIRVFSCRTDDKNKPYKNDEN